MVSCHAQLHKKFEEFETHVYHKLQKPVELQSVKTIEKIQSKIDFFKTFFAIEIESSSPGNPQHLEGLVDRLSALEQNFDEWVTSGSTEGPISPCSCTSSCFDDDDDEKKEEEEEKNGDKLHEEEHEEAVAGGKRSIHREVTKEKIREDLEVDLLKNYLQNVVAEKIAKANKKDRRRRRGWVRWVGTIGVAAVVAAIGLAVIGFGSMEESAHLVPT